MKKPILSRARVSPRIKQIWSVSLSIFDPESQQNPKYVLTDV